MLEKGLTFNIFNPRHWLVRFQKKRIIQRIIQRGDQFLVANLRQKDYWLKTARELKIKIKKDDISIIPTGAPIPSTVNRQPSTVILWFGGIYPWMDPKPLIAAFSEISSIYPDWKLRFLGGFYEKSGYVSYYEKMINYAKRKIKPDNLEVVKWQKFYNLPTYLLFSRLNLPFGWQRYSDS